MDRSTIQRLSKSLGTHLPVQSQPAVFDDALVTQPNVSSNVSSSSSSHTDETFTSRPTPTRLLPRGLRLLAFVCIRSLDITRIVVVPLNGSPITLTARTSFEMLKWAASVRMVYCRWRINWNTSSGLSQLRHRIYWLKGRTVFFLFEKGHQLATPAAAPAFNLINKNATHYMPSCFERKPKRSHLISL